VEEFVKEPVEAMFKAPVTVSATTESAAITPPNIFVTLPKVPRIN